MTTYVAPSSIVVEVLKDDNYKIWKSCMRSYLLAQGLWDIVQPSNNQIQSEEGFKAPNGQVIHSKSPEDKLEAPYVEEVSKTCSNQEGACIKAPNNQEVIHGAQFDQSWNRRNAAALHAIQISCAPEILSEIGELESAEEAWRTLAKMKNPLVPSVSGLVTSNDYGQVVDVNNYIYRRDWDATRKFYEKNPINMKIAGYGGTALHVATLAGSVNIVKELVKLMSPEDLEIQDVTGSTGLSYAALLGNTKMAKYMLEKNKKLVSIENLQGRLPVVISCRANHKELTCYLYSQTPLEVLLDQDNGTHGSLLLQSSIISKMLDIALDLLHHSPTLATTLDKMYESNGLLQLSNMPEVFPSATLPALWQRWIYYCIPIGSTIPCNFEHSQNLDQSKSRPKIVAQQVLLSSVLGGLFKFLGIKKIYDLKLNHDYSRKLLRRMCQQVSELDYKEYGKYHVREAFNRGIKNGIVEFIIEMVKFTPTLILNIDRNDRGLFMNAILYRQEKIFSLFYGLDGTNANLVSSVDSFRNTSLHVAAMLSPPAQLARISGAALQMQREIQWYEGVEKIVNPVTKMFRNINGHTPSELFTKSHRELLIEGEKWMKDTATSSTVVAALIITVMFTAAFTVPGGNKDTGFPIFLHKKSFLTFIIADAISLFTSSTSVLMFLGILTSRYAEKDFLRSLPTKLIIGLSTLFISIASMMVAFCATIVIVLDRKLQLVIPISFLAGIPVFLFMSLQFPLLVEIFMSTFGPGIFNKRMKRWY